MEFPILGIPKIFNPEMPESWLKCVCVRRVRRNEMEMCVERNLVIDELYENIPPGEEHAYLSAN